MRISDWSSDVCSSDLGGLSPDQLKDASQGSCNVLRQLGPDIQWVHSYVTDDKIYCVYRAPSEELIRRHAEMAGFPANSLARICATIDPTTADRTEEHKSEIQSLMRIPYVDFCLQKKNNK